jgi:hypothetical protein
MNMTQVAVTVTVEQVASAICPEGGLRSFNEGLFRAFNEGNYATFPLRPLRGDEPVQVVGTISGARIVAKNVWVADRLGNTLGARQVKRLLGAIG